KIGATELTFSLYDMAAESAEHEQAAHEEALAAYRRLYDFSARLFERYELAELLEALMDAVIDIASAGKGFLILLEDNELHVKVARNLKRENLADAIEQLSDSIVDKVVKTKKPMIVSDALHDAEFQNAMSVMSLKLSSVMCVPLVDRGSLLGV